jgi:hypothetical protein
MKYYQRAKEKRLTLHSINDYTAFNDDEDEISSCRSDKDQALFHYSEDYGGRGDQPGGDCAADWSGQAEHQQTDEGERCGKHRFPFEDCGEHRSGCGTEDHQEDRGDAA